LYNALFGAKQALDTARTLLNGAE